MWGRIVAGIIGHGGGGGGGSEVNNRLWAWESLERLSEKYSPRTGSEVTIVAHGFAQSNLDNVYQLAMAVAAGLLNTTDQVAISRRYIEVQINHTAKVIQVTLGFETSGVIGNAGRLGTGALVAAIGAGVAVGVGGQLGAGLGIPVLAGIALQATNLGSPLISAPVNAVVTGGVWPRFAQAPKRVADIRTPNTDSGTLLTGTVVATDVPTVNPGLSTTNVGTAPNNNGVYGAPDMLLQASPVNPPPGPINPLRNNALAALANLYGIT